jgi:hypothetical protein
VVSTLPLTHRRQLRCRLRKRGATNSYAYSNAGSRRATWESGGTTNPNAGSTAGGRRATCERGVQPPPYAGGLRAACESGGTLRVGSRRQRNEARGWPATCESGGRMITRWPNAHWAPWRRIMDEHPAASTISHEPQDIFSAHIERKSFALAIDDTREENDGRRLPLSLTASQIPSALDEHVR